MNQSFKDVSILLFFSIRLRHIFNGNDFLEKDLIHLKIHEIGLPCFSSLQEICNPFPPPVIVGIIYCKVAESFLFRDVQP